jgi:hypothetical protein
MCEIEREITSETIIPDALLIIRTTFYTSLLDVKFSFIIKFSKTKISLLVSFTY